jgi:hypothetical protein
MPKMKEFTIHMEDRPGTLGKFCRALADRGVNIIAFQASSEEKGKSIIRLVTDNPTATKTILESGHVKHTEDQIVEAKLPHRVGSLATAAVKLGEAKINVDHAYVGVEPGSSKTVVIFGVAEVDKAAKILDEVSAAAA